MSWSQLYYHVVWATRGREPLITPALEPLVHRQLRQIAQHQRIFVHAVGGTDDHIHMAISIPPTLAIATAMKQIKGASSHAIRPEAGGTFGWQEDYGISSFSKRHLPQVVAYIENQRRHHADQTLWAAIEPFPDRSRTEAPGPRSRPT
jgi:putative transposase